MINVYDLHMEARERAKARKCMENSGSKVFKVANASRQDRCEATYPERGCSQEG